MSQLLIQIHSLVPQSTMRTERLVSYGKYILTVQILVAVMAVVNIWLIYDYSVDVSFACAAFTVFGWYCMRRITKHMDAITDSLDDLTDAIDPSKFKSVERIVSQVYLLKNNVEKHFLLIIFKVF